MELKKFLTDFSICYFEWSGISKDMEARFIHLVERLTVADPELTELQNTILEQTVLSATASKFPPSVDRTRKLFKFVVVELETRGIEAREEFYKAVAAPSPIEQTLQFKSYFNDGEYLLSLAERTESICEGTTGLTTWTAAKRLLRWLQNSPGTNAAIINENMEALVNYCILSKLVLRHAMNLLLDKFCEVHLDGHVLELGSGTGFTGIGLAKCGLVRGKLTLTDHHRLVLDALSTNVNLNLTSENGWMTQENGDGFIGKVYTGPTCDVSVELLDWQLFNASNAQELNANIVIGADIIFDEEILPALVETIRLLIDVDNVAGKRHRAFVAGVVRNEKTSKTFVRLLQSQNLNVDIIILDETPLINLYSICSQVERSSMNRSASL